MLYLPNFLNAEEESNLIEFLHAQEWDSSEIKRETQHFGHKYHYRKNTLPVQVPPIPTEFRFLLDRLVPHTSQEFDQAIVNRYQPGEGIGAHIDDPKLYDDVVVSISLLSEIPMVFHSRHGTYVQQLERFSAVILDKEARYRWTHCIQPRMMDGDRPRQERISITFRKMRSSKRARD
jgi:alkylated DNA repair dioxygenase AlkB